MHDAAARAEARHVHRTLAAHNEVVARWNSSSTTSLGDDRHRKYSLGASVSLCAASGIVRKPRGVRGTYCSSGESGVGATGVVGWTGALPCTVSPQPQISCLWNESAPMRAALHSSDEPLVRVLQLILMLLRRLVLCVAFAVYKRRCRRRCWPELPPLNGSRPSRRPFRPPRPFSSCSCSRLSSTQPVRAA